ncbi:pentapeptide repeat-containing protein, partial [Pseudomonas sp. SAICEU22]
MKFLPLLLLFIGAVAHADDPDTALTIKGCTIAESSQCPGANLRGAKLANQDLRKMNLAGADLRDADLRHARLDLANLEKAQLQGANLNRASLQQSNLRLADFSGAKLKAIQGWGLFAQGAQFQRADLTAA